jgi:hypothetical protein
MIPASMIGNQNRSRPKATKDEKARRSKSFTIQRIALACMSLRLVTDHLHSLRAGALPEEHGAHAEGKGQA